MNETEITLILLPVILEALGKANRKLWKKNPQYRSWEGPGVVTRMHITLVVSNSHLQNQFSHEGKKQPNNKPEIQPAHSSVSDSLVICNLKLNFKVTLC